MNTIRTAIYTLLIAMAFCVTLSDVFAQAKPTVQPKPIVLPKRQFKIDWADGVFLAGSFADVTSSVGKFERNPILRRDDGRFSVGKGITLKLSLFGALKVIEYYHPQNKRTMRWTKFGIGVVFGCIAIRNAGVKR